MRPPNQPLPQAPATLAQRRTSERGQRQRAPRGSRERSRATRRAAFGVSLVVAALVSSAAVAGEGPTLLDREMGASKQAPAVTAPKGVTKTAAAPVRVRTIVAPRQAPKYPRIEWHGYFRFRPDVVSNGHLGQAVASELNQYPVLTASAIKPPLSQWPQNNGDANGFSSKVGKARDEDSISIASVRLRLRPTVHVSDNVRLTFTADLFDNHVLGSRPDYAGALARPDVPLSAFALNSQPSAIRIHEAYGEWKTLVGLLRIGRQASHWGLGLLANGGMGNTWDYGRPIAYYGGALRPADGFGYDADFGNYADRAAFVTQVKGTYVALFWDYIAQGAIATEATRYDSPMWDMDNSDDVSQWGFAIFSKPLNPTEIAARKKALLQDHGSVLDWGVYGIFRTQDTFTNNSAKGKGGQIPSEATAEDQSSLKLAPRGAWAFAGDLWLRYENRMSFSRRLVLETEFVYLRGHIDDASPVASASSAPKEKEIEMWGGALKGAFQIDNMGIYLDAGIASGDDTRCFGVYGPGNCGLDDANGDPNKFITGMKFHKNFRVDNILFRDVIGAVTNAWYVKPTFSINAHPFYSPTDLLGADLSVLFAGALNPEGTPGNGSTLGTEFEVRGFLGQKGQFLTSLSFSYLLPGDALDVVGPDDERGKWLGATATANAQNAWRLMLRTVLSF